MSRSSTPLLALLTLATVTLTPAVVAAQESPGALPSFGPLLLQVTVSLLVVCALAYLVIRFGLTRLQPRARPDAGMEVLESLPVGARRSIVMVRARDRVLVVGITEQGMSLLSDFGPGSAEENASASFKAVMDGIEAEDGSGLSE